ncbi:MAG: tetratricopeptide repeat protein, partial [Pedobacter sp.]
ENNEQLFLTAQHLEQYRHATYSPVPYYEEALKRDDKDFRCNNAIGLLYLRRGQFAKSEGYFRKAIETSIQRNPNPYDTEPYYNLGLCLKFQDKLEEAYQSFYKATWGRAWKDSGFFAVAQIDLARTDYPLALEHITLAIDSNASNSKSYVLKSAAYRNLGRSDQSIAVSNQALERDPFNLGALYELSVAYEIQDEKKQSASALSELLKLSRGYEQNFIEYALDYAAAGLNKEAMGLLLHAVKPTGTNPLVHYYLGWLNYKMQDEKAAIAQLKLAAAADSYLCFPNRLEEINVLKLAISLNPEDAKAPYYLGNLFYDKRQYDDAIAYWELSAELDGSFPTTLRNLGIAYFNKRNDEQKALACFEKAFKLDSTDDRLCMELHQLYKRLNYSPAKRREFLEANLKTALERDDLYLEWVTIHNALGEYEKAFELVTTRQFHPWEGGEGKASGQYVFSLVEMAKQRITIGEYTNAINFLNSAQSFPHNLGEGKLFGAQEN